MNKVENINLGGVPFIINQDAYNRLYSYLEAVKIYFADSSGRDEIMEDIEIRIAEIFNERLQGRQIVDNAMVDNAISRLGRPEQFEDTDTEQGESFSASANDDNARRSSGNFKEKEYTVGRKLFRDKDNKVIAGVASGLAAYFGVDNPVWIRLLFVLLMFGGMSGGLIYVVLWILMPTARTAADRLAMKGEPINISSIARIIEEEITGLGKKFESWTK